MFPATNWCAREDLNLHPLRDQILSLERLPFRHARSNEIQILDYGWSGSGILKKSCQPP